MRRVLSRAFLVIGGALASTAAAWALSSATAAADTGADLVPFPSQGIDTVTVQPVPVPGVDLVTGLTDAIGRIIGAQDPTFGQRATVAVDEFGRAITAHLDPTQTLPHGTLDPAADAGGIDLSALTQRGDSTDGVTAAPPVATQPVATATTLVGVRPGAIDQTVVGGAIERALSDGMSRRGSPETSPEAPAPPFGPSPLVPMGVVPAPVGSGHTGSGSVDAPTLGLLSSVGSGTDLDAADAPRSDDVLVPAIPGTQPGVTPD